MGEGIGAMGEAMRGTMGAAAGERRKEDGAQVREATACCLGHQAPMAAAIGRAAILAAALCRTTIRAPVKAIEEIIIVCVVCCFLSLRRPKQTETIEIEG
jgi:hypothetical protein